MEATIRTKASNNAYRDGWDKLFGKDKDWRIGRSILAIRAIQVAARITGKEPEEVLLSNYWKTYLYDIN